jgi:cell division protease FtsH
MFGNGLDARNQISYTLFRQQLQDGNVEQVTVSGDQIQGELKEPIQADTEGTEAEGEESPTFSEFVTYLPSFGDEQLLSLLEEQGVEVETRPDTEFSWWAILINFLPFILLIGLGVWFFSRMRSQGQGIFSVGKSQAKLYDREKAEQERTTFEDVAGAEGAKRELREIVEYLKSPERVQRLGGEAPKGVLLVGPPGTGKTLLARAVAGEAAAPFYSITGSDFMEMFVGVGASRVRDLFKNAKQTAPSIIFIDELDSIGRRRGAGLGGGHDEREQTLNQLLSELDGFEPNESVIVMAATNRPDILDPALLRPGRFDRRITVDLPTMESRHEILKIHSRNKPLGDEVDLKEMARASAGFSGADLENLLNEAALLAARNDKDAIEWEDIEEARDKILMGLEREGVALTDKERELIAYHEAGHAVVAAVLPSADPVHKVTIIPRGRAMGVTQQLPEKDKYIYDRNYMLDRLAVMMGGRAAEDLVLETATSGAENDLKQATQLARRMVLSWGMSERLGRVAWGGEREQVFLGEEIAQRREYSESTAREIDEEVKGILEESFQRAVDTLTTYRDGLEKLAEALLDREEVPGKEVITMIGVDKTSASSLSDNNRSVEEIPAIV